MDHHGGPLGGVVRVYPIGTITRGEKGQELSEMADMAHAGAVAFSDDGNMVKSARLMRNALAYSRVTGRPIVDHAEDPDLVDGGVMHDGRVASILGLRGAASEAEEVAVARDIALARATGRPAHLAHSRRRPPSTSCGRRGPGASRSPPRPRPTTS